MKKVNGLKLGEDFEQNVHWHLGHEPQLPLTIVYCISFANSFALDLAALLFCFFGGCDVEALDFMLHGGSTGGRFQLFLLNMQEEQRHYFSHFSRDCRASALGQARLEEELDLPTTYLPIKKIKFQALNVTAPFWLPLKDACHNSLSQSLARMRLL